ncbi:hypothetical protein, partial [Streptomyces sp. NPDC014793]|uniref:hypothetical protein n=2 Tax=Bacteria TaxID=2 RepID=UPI0036FF348D
GPSTLADLRKAGVITSRGVIAVIDAYIRQPASWALPLPRGHRTRRELTRAEWTELKGMLRLKSELQCAWMLKELYGFKYAERASAQLDRFDKRDQGRWTEVMQPMGRALEMSGNTRSRSSTGTGGYRTTASPRA